MDNNPVNQPVQPTTQPVQSQPASVPQPPQPTGVEQPKSSKKMILMLVLGLTVAVILVGGAYFYANQSKVQTPPKEQENLETELDQINVEDLEEEFTTVEADLKNL